MTADLAREARELLPCPWCGEEPEINVGGRLVGIECNNPACIVTPTLVAGNEPAARKAWNTRCAAALDGAGTGLAPKTITLDGEPSFDCLANVTGGPCRYPLCGCSDHAALDGAPAAPLDMVIRCPHCGTQHIDKAEPESGWDNPPHTSHLCHNCGAIWRDASVPTNGVASVPPGKHDRPPAKAPAAPDGGEEPKPIVAGSEDEPDWMPAQSAIGLPEGHKASGSTGQEWVVRAGRWERIRKPKLQIVASTAAPDTAGLVERAVALAICRSENNGKCGCENVEQLCLSSQRSAKAALAAIKQPTPPDVVGMGTCVTLPPGVTLLPPARAVQVVIGNLERISESLVGTNGSLDAATVAEAASLLRALTGQAAPSPTPPDVVGLVERLADIAMDECHYERLDDDAAELSQERTALVERFTAALTGQGTKAAPAKEE